MNTPLLEDHYDLAKITKDLLRKYALVPSKQQGQNFAIDPHLFQTILQGAELQTSDIVLEIGPGLGILTRLIAEHVKQVITIEKDPILATILARELIPTQDNITLITGDALSLTFPPFTTFISNLPFNVSIPLTLKIFQECTFNKFVATYQKEVALRLIAQPGSKYFSRLSVLSSLRGRWKKLKTFPPRSFYPAPKVAASMLKFIPNSSYPIEIFTNHFKKYIETIFQHRRQKLRNSLKFFTKIHVNDHLYQKVITKIDQLPVKDQRPFTLEPMKLYEIYIELFKS
ncbi:MAG: 16S rRNA (adenine(1518)-N(6)/adenine(1519)-N(6))-dimethyltransferase RsmA [Candidatus Hermodarchaeota archaeon]